MKLRTCVWLFGLCACASEADMKEPDIEVDPTMGVEIQVLGDGFVRTGGQRIPLEAFVLSTRQRVRALPQADRPKFWVRILLDPAAGDAVQPFRDRLLTELSLMGVQQVLYLAKQ
jgi:hypothetical protein